MLTIKVDKNIIKYLKENKKNAKPFAFLPHGVRYWIVANWKNPKLLSFDYSKNKWIQANNVINVNDVSEVHPERLFGLPDDFKSEELYNSEWIDFDIDSNGDFYIGTDKYRWFEKDKAMAEHNSKAFGGWYYDGKGWYMLPVVAIDVGDEKGKIIATAYATGEAAKPMIPSKIRFLYMGSLDK